MHRAGVDPLSTKPDHQPRRYEDESGKNYVEVRPSSDGLATIHDRDVLIYCISQVIAALNEGRQVQRVVRLKAYDMLKEPTYPKRWLTGH
ncbi:replication initiator protein A [Sulfitobacter sp. HNIBRBA3233]|uniref:replication initiator protein A n=1 Tax=Sulfitobacter marinivivus TaxID=3158558 RepID=UPI0032DEDCF5